MATTTRTTRLNLPALCALLAPLVACAGCLDRTLLVTSDPPGASVTVNDVEVGRTPVEASFTYYGTYDVLLTLEGHEPLRTRATASAPVYEYPPLDLAAEALPARIRNQVKWHFTLRPSPEASAPTSQVEADVADRARALRERLSPVDQ
ncbi:MAG: PEGA domain-containing protein [Phycisphaerales bacterium]